MSLMVIFVSGSLSTSFIPEHGCNDPSDERSLSFRHTERQWQVFHHFARTLAAADLRERITISVMG